MISQGPDSGIYAMLRQAMLNNCKDKGHAGRIKLINLFFSHSKSLMV